MPRAAIDNGGMGQVPSLGAHFIRHVGNFYRHILQRMLGLRLHDVLENPSVRI